MHFSRAAETAEKMVRKFVEPGELNTLHKVFFGKSSDSDFLLASLLRSHIAYTPRCTYCKWLNKKFRESIWMEMNTTFGSKLVHAASEKNFWN